MIKATPVYQIQTNCPGAWDSCTGYVDIYAYLLVEGVLETFVSVAGRPPVKTSKPWSAKILPQRYKAPFKRVNETFGCRVELCGTLIKTHIRGPQPKSISDYLYEGPLQVEVEYKYQTTEIVENPAPTYTEPCLKGRVEFHWISGIFLISGSLTAGIRALLDLPGPNVNVTGQSSAAGGIGLGGPGYKLGVDWQVCCESGECVFEIEQGSVTDAEAVFNAAL